MGHFHPSIAHIYNNIGYFHVEFYQFAQARHAFELSLDIQQNALVEKLFTVHFCLEYKQLCAILDFCILRNYYWIRHKLYSWMLYLSNKVFLTTMDACTKNNQIQHAIQCYLQIVYGLQTKTK